MDIKWDFKFEKLTAENDHTKLKMKMFLIGKNLWDIVNGADVLAEYATAEEKSKFRKQDILLWQVLTCLLPV